MDVLDNNVDKATIDIRSASVNDKGDIANLIYSASTDLYDYIYNTKRKHALDYIHNEFKSKRGLCSHKLLTVAVHDNKVVATGTFYDRDGYNTMSSGTTMNMLGFYKFHAIPVLQRALDSMKLMKPPKDDELYLANFGVSPALRGQGIGSKLLKHKIAEAKQSGYRIVSLDVATQNPKAEALYSRLGFAVTDSKSMKGRDGKHYACKKMELFL